MFSFVYIMGFCNQLFIFVFFCEGPIGLRGMPGKIGAPGAPGERGSQGLQGKQGEAGLQGDALVYFTFDLIFFCESCIIFFPVQFTIKSRLNL